MRGPGAVSGPPHGVAVALGAALLALWLVAMAFTLRAADHETGTVIALFRPGSAPRTEARPGPELIRGTWLPFARVVTSDEAGFVGRLRREGALAVFRTVPFAPATGGCMAVVSHHEPAHRASGEIGAHGPSPGRQPHGRATSSGAVD